jgi:hypothetical protein
MDSAYVGRRDRTIGFSHYFGHGRPRTVGVYPERTGAKWRRCDVTKWRRRSEERSYVLQADDPANVLAGFQVLIALLHFIE